MSTQPLQNAVWNAWIVLKLLKQGIAKTFEFCATVGDDQTPTKALLEISYKDGIFQVKSETAQRGLVSPLNGICHRFGWKKINANFWECTVQQLLGALPVLLGARDDEEHQTSMAIVKDSWKNLPESDLFFFLMKPPLVGSGCVIQNLYQDLEAHFEEYDQYTWICISEITGLTPEIQQRIMQIPVQLTQ
jgi:hypothetical protein